MRLYTHYQVCKFVLVINLVYLSGCCLISNGIYGEASLCKFVQVCACMFAVL